MVRRRRRKVNARSLFSLLIVGGIGVTTWWLWNRERPHFVRYPEFGIEIPANFPIHGIDVSRYQSHIDWEEVKDMKVEKVQIDFAFIKATEGTGKVDVYYARNWKRSQDAGMVRGAYHFFCQQKTGVSRRSILSMQWSWKKAIFPLCLTLNTVMARLQKN